MIIVGGYFNSVQDGIRDRLPSEKAPQSKKSKTLNSMITELGLVETWRSYNPKGKDSSFSLNVHGSYSRIDFICLSNQYIYKIVESHIEPITLSDHAPVILMINLCKENYFRYWRLNTSLLTKQPVVQELKNDLKEYFDINNNGEVTPSTLWDGAKSVIRGKIIQISSRIKRAQLEKQNWKTKLNN